MEKRDKVLILMDLICTKGLPLKNHVSHKLRIGIPWVLCIDIQSLESNHLGPFDVRLKVQVLGYVVDDEAIWAVRG